MAGFLCVHLFTLISLHSFHLLDVFIMGQYIGNLDTRAPKTDLRMLQLIPLNKVQVSMKTQVKNGLKETAVSSSILLRGEF